MLVLVKQSPIADHSLCDREVPKLKGTSHLAEIVDSSISLQSILNAQVLIPHPIFSSLFIPTIKIKVTVITLCRIYHTGLLRFNSSPGVWSQMNLPTLYIWSISGLRSPINDSVFIPIVEVNFLCCLIFIVNYHPVVMVQYRFRVQRWLNGLRSVVVMRLLYDRGAHRGLRDEPFRASLSILNSIWEKLRGHRVVARVNHSPATNYSSCSHVILPWWFVLLLATITLENRTWARVTLMAIALSAFMHPLPLCPALITTSCAFINWFIRSLCRVAKHASAVVC